MQKMEDGRLAKAMIRNLRLKTAGRHWSVQLESKLILLFFSNERTNA